MKLKSVPEEEATVITKTYEIPENVLRLILGIETLLEANRDLPEEYLKECCIFLNKLKTMAGLKESKYKLYAITQTMYYYKVKYTEEYREVNNK